MVTPPMVSPCSMAEMMPAVTEPWSFAHRVADGNRQPANLELIAVAERGGIQTLRVDS